MTDTTNPGYQLAQIYEEIEQAKKVRAEFLKNDKEHMEALVAEANRLRHEVLTGQKDLFAAAESEPELEDAGPAPDYIAEPISQAMAEKLDAAIVGVSKVDTLLPAAIEYSRKWREVNAWRLRHHFGITAVDSIRLIDAMEAQGLLLPATDSGPRKFKQEQTA